MRLLMLIACEYRGAPPWIWRLRRTRLRRRPGLLWLDPLRPLQATDVTGWCDGYSGDLIRRHFNPDTLRSDLLELFESARDIRYQQARKRLLDGGALDHARTAG